MRTTAATRLEIGIEAGFLHAVRPDAIAAIAGPNSATEPYDQSFLGTALCGDHVRMTDAWGAWQLSNSRLRIYRLCPTCAWTYALLNHQVEWLFGLTDITFSRRMHEATEQVCRAILAAEGDGVSNWDYDDPDGHPHPRLVELLAKATEHGPVPHTEPTCQRGSTHGTAGCPAELVCMSCCVTHPQPDNRANDVDSLCHLTAPCSSFAEIAVSHHVDLAQLIPAAAGLSSN